MGNSLLDTFFGTPEQTQALSLLGAGMASGNFAGGMNNATSLLANAPDVAMKRKLMAEELVLKQLQEQRAQALFKMQQDAYNGIGQPMGGSSGAGQPAGLPMPGGPLGSGSFGITTPGQAAGPTQSNIAAQMDRLERMAIAGVPGAKEALDIFKFKNTPQQIAAGGYTRDPLSGSMAYQPDPVKGVTMGQDGSVQMMPNALNTITAQTLATEAPKTLLSSAASLNLRPNANGTQSPVSALAENPTLQDVLSRVLGPQRGNVGAPAGFTPPAAPVAPRAGSEAAQVAAGVAGPMGPDPAALAREIAQTQAGIASVTDPQSKAALTAHLADMQQQLARVQQNPGSTQYGPTTEQQAKDAANKAFLEGRAKNANSYESSLNGRVAQGADMNMRLQEQLAALEKFKAGGGGETRAQLAQMAQGIPGMPDAVVRGIAGGDLAAMQEFNKLAAQTAMEQLKQSMGGAGRISQYEFKVFQNNNPNLSTDPNAIRKIFDFNTRIFNRDLGEQRGFNAHIQGGGNPGDFESLWQQQQAKQGYTNPNMSAQPPAAAPVRIKGEADYAALPSGAVFIDPFGKQRRKP